MRLTIQWCGACLRTSGEWLAASKEPFQPTNGWLVRGLAMGTRPLLIGATLLLAIVTLAIVAAI